MRQLGFPRAALVLLAVAGMIELMVLADAHAADSPKKVWAGFGMVDAPPSPQATAPTTASSSAFLRASPSPRVDVSGHWLGTWTAPGEDGARGGSVVADFTQAGKTGAGKLVLHDTMAAEAIPSALRHAGGGGVPVVLAVSGARLRVEHELGGDLVTALFEVRGDHMAGLFEHSKGRVRVRLSRAAGESTAGRGEKAETPGGERNLAAAQDPDGGRTEGADATSGGRSQAKAPGPDAGSQLTEMRALAERAATTADAAASLAREASAKAAASAATAGEALATAEQTDRRLGALRGGRLQAVASRVVTFAFNKADLDDAGQTALVEVAAQVREHPDFMVNLEGYTDAVGTRDYNLQLSQRRAAAVVRYLVEKGVELSRIHWVGLGVLAGPKAPEEQAKKRRVTVTVLSATTSGAQASADAQSIRPSEQSAQVDTASP